MEATLECPDCGETITGTGNTQQDAEIDASYKLLDHQETSCTEAE